MHKALVVGLALIASILLGTRAEALVYDFTRTSANGVSAECTTVGCTYSNLAVAVNPGYGTKVQGEGTTEVLSRDSLIDLGIGAPQSAKFTTAHDGLIRLTYRVVGIADVGLFNGFTITGPNGYSQSGTSLLTIGLIGNVLTLVYSDIAAPEGSYTASFTSGVSLSAISESSMTLTTPIPAALPLLASALIAVGGLALRRKRPQQGDDQGHASALAA